MLIDQLGAKSVTEVTVVDRWFEAAHAQPCIPNHWEAKGQGGMEGHWMSGGNATNAGIVFQNEVAAFFAAHILADVPVPFLDLPSGARPISLEMETSAPVDDILIQTSDSGFCFFNVKKGVSQSKRPESPIASVIDQFVRLWIACKSGKSTRSWQRPLDAGRDRLILVTTGNRSATFVSAASRVLGRISDDLSVSSRDLIAITTHERKVYDTLLHLLRASIRRHLGEEPRDADLQELLRMVRVLSLDPEGNNKAHALSLLQTAVVSQPDEAEHAWVELKIECTRLSSVRSGVDRGRLRQLLSGKGIRLRDVAEFAADLQQLQQITKETLATLSHLAHIEVLEASGKRKIEISRDVANRLAEQAPQASFLVIGAPGAGKSGALFSAAKHLIEGGHPVVVLAVDQHPVNTLDQLRRDLGLDKPLLEVLSNWNSEKEGVLFIDALDASRGGPSDSVFQDLIRGVLEGITNWRIVASIRIFDLRFGATYRELFHGSPIDPTYADSEFTDVRHLSIPQLTSVELAQFWMQAPLLYRTFEDGTKSFRELLRSPFNLFLLAGLFTRDMQEVRNVSTQVELLHLYWSHRVIGNDKRGFARERALRTALGEMLNDRTLQVSVDEVQKASAPEDLYHLISDGVLSPYKRTGDRIARVSFAHHFLFDYAIARLVLEEGHASDFLTLLIGSDDRALVLAPGAILALQMLWDGDEKGRPQFWKKALEIAISSGAGAFCRMLPARVAAELTSDIADFQVPIEWLSATSGIERTGALFLIRHCIGAYVAGILSKTSSNGPRGAWSSIARALVTTAVEDVAWTIKPLIAQFVENPAALTSADKTDINAAARALLRYGSGEKYDRSLVIFGIQGIARTYEAAPDESAIALRYLLSPTHVEDHGYEELFWLAGDLKHMPLQTSLAGALAGDIYRAAYCTPLPSAEEKTNLGGSRILALTSNKRQDFEAARHILFDSYQSFFEANPIYAAQTLIDIVSCSKSDSRLKTDETKVNCGEVTIRYRPDYSYMWIGHERDGLPIQAFETGMVSLVDSQNRELMKDVLSLVYQKNSFASVWAALLRAATRRPQVLGLELVPILTAKPILEGLDTRKPAGDLISVLHPLLGKQERTRIEDALLTTAESTRHVLLGCLQEQNIILDEVRRQRDAYASKGELLPNHESFSITGGPSDEDWYLRDQGVDLSDENNKHLKNAIDALQARLKGSEKTASLPAWTEVEQLRDAVNSRTDTPDALLRSAWGVLAEAARLFAEETTSPDVLAAYPGITAIIFEAIEKDIWTPSTADPETEASFAKFPSWGAPAPRVEAASAAMALARAIGSPNDALSRLIGDLVRDPYPAVRLQVLSRANMLFDANKDLMWMLLTVGFTDETNDGIVSFFLSAAARVLHANPEWFSERLLALDRRVDAPERSDFVRHIVQLILRLWLVHDNASAGLHIQEWVLDPIQHSSRIQETFPCLRGAILRGDVGYATPEEERIRKRSVSIFESVVLKTVPLFTELSVKKGLTDEERSTMELSLRILDSAATELYFGSGAYDGTRRNKTSEENVPEPGPSVRVRLLEELGTTFAALGRVPYPSVTHHLLETLQFFIPDAPEVVFRLVTDCLLMGGRTGGYHFETLGSDLFVRIVRRYLADFRGVLTAKQDLLDRLMRSLDVFVEAGWPEARRLVYDLPEMLR